MHVYISVDMEGIAGVATEEQTLRGGRGYAKAQELMTGEANAAIEGAFDGGATKVTVSDSHGLMVNLLHEQLDPRARLVFGAPRAQCMVHGLGPDHDLALFIGYHGAAGQAGVLSHTFSSLFTSFKVNDEVASEALVNTILAGSHGVPVGLVTGDDAACADAGFSLPGVDTVEVKQALGRSAASSLHPSLARDLVRAGAANAVSAAATYVPVPVPEELDLEVSMEMPAAAELAAMVPGTERLSELSVRHSVTSVSDLMGLVAVWFELASSAYATKASILRR